MIGCNRRRFLSGLSVSGLSALVYTKFFSSPADSKNIEKGDNNASQQTYLSLSEEDWKRRLSPMEYYVLREEGTEKPGSSPLNHETRAGVYHCVGCDNPLFASSAKYDSGTGWPSFYDYIDDSLNTKRDYKLFIPRTEYHCARCGGHHGHVFSDGPEPTGLRYCNNGVTLRFKPAKS